MSQQVHDMTGRECGMCGFKFTPVSLNLTIKQKAENGSIETIRTCGKCYNNFYAQGEQ